MRGVLTALPLGLVFPLLIFVGSVSPHQLASNTSQWAAWIGINAPWLMAKQTDNWIVAAALLFCMVYSVVAYRPRPATRSPASNVTGEARRPSLLSLFMSDFANYGTAGGVAAILSGETDAVFTDATTSRFFVHLILDFGSQSKFLVAFIPHSPRAFDTAKFLAGAYSGYLNLNLYGEVNSIGVQTSTTTAHLIFTGRIFVYYDNSITLAQMAELGTLFTKNNVNAEFRSTSYAFAVLDSIRSGVVKQPPEYEIKNGSICEAAA